MLYFKADFEMQSFSHRKHDWLTIENDELLTERELARYQRMGYKINYSDFTPIVSSQKNVKFVNGSRFVINENKIAIYWKGRIEQ